METRKTRSEKFGDFANWAYDNSRTLLVVAVGCLMIPVLMLVFLQKDDPELSNRVSRMELAAGLETEVRSLKLPDDTVLAELVNNSEYKPNIFISADYSTTAKKEVFLEHLKTELVSKGCNFYKQSKDRSFTTFAFCRGKFDANLSYNPGGIFEGEGAGDWKLFVGTSMRIYSWFGQ